MEPVQRKKKKPSSSSSSKGSDIIILDDNNFDKLVLKDEKNTWFIKFYAPWCGHCKAMIPDWEKLAAETKGKIKIGKVDATSQKILASRFKIQGFPSLKLFPAGTKSDSLAQSYDGPRSADELIKYAMTFYNVKIEAEQLLINEQLMESCKSGVCILAFLPHILDSKADGRNKLIKTFNEIVKASTSKPITFLWLQGGDQLELEEQLRLGFGYPALIALNMSKKRFSVHKGTFQKDSINSFINGLMTGTARLEELPQNLKEIKKTEKWNGKDFEEEKSKSTQKEKDEKDEL